MAGSGVLATNAVIAAGSSTRREVMNPPPPHGVNEPATAIPASGANSGLTDPNPSTATESRWDAALGFVESDNFNYAVTGVIGTYFAGSAVAGAASTGVTAAASAGAVATAGFAATLGVGIAVGAAASWLGHSLASSAFESLGFAKFGQDSELPATVDHPIAHSFAAAGAWGMLGGALAGIAVGLLVIATGGLALAVIAGAAVAGLAMGISSAAGEFGSNEGKILQGSPNVFFNGKPVARIGDIIECSKHSNPPPKLAEGSKTVFANNKSIVRVGHKTTCAGAVNDGCSNISITKQTHPVRLSIKTGWDIRIARTLTAIVNLLPFPRGKKGNQQNKSSRSRGKPDDCATCRNDPIDVANGDFLDSRTDFVIPATLPIVFNRSYRSKSEAHGQLGHKWSNSWSQHLIVDGDEIHFHDEQGQIITFYNPEEAIHTEHLRHPQLQLSGQKSKTLTIFNRNEQCTYEFAHADQGRRWLSRIVDRNRNQIEFDYGEQGLLAVRHSDGLALSVESRHGIIQHILLEQPDAHPQSLVEYHYSPQGYLSRVDSFQQGTFNYQYDNKGRMVTWSDTKDTDVRYEYDEQDRIIKTGAQSGHHQGQFVYDDENHSTTVIYPHDKQETFYYDNDGLVIRFIDGNGHEWLTEWNEQFQITATTDPLGHQHRYQYDDQGNLTQTIDPEGRSNTFTYTPDGLPQSRTDANGHNWNTTRDERGNLKSIKNPLGESQGYRHNDQGQVLRIDLANSSQQRIDYDAYHRPQVLHNSQGYQQQLNHDLLGRLTDETDGDGQSTRYEYVISANNPRGNLSRILHLDGSQSHYRYDQEGQLKSHTDAEGHTTHYQHGAFDLLESITDPQGNTLKYEYDAETRLTAVINQQGERYEYRYDPAGNLITETDYSGLKTHYRYDAAERLIQTQKPDHSTSDYHYDNSGRLLKKTSQADGQAPLVTDYTYDDAGQITRIDNGSVTLEYEYDPLGRVSLETIDGKAIQSHYKKGVTGRIQRSGQGQALDYDYDSEEGLSQLAIGEHAPLNYQRNLKGQEQSRHSDSGFQLAQHWDAFGRLQQQIAGNQDSLKHLLDQDSQLLRAFPNNAQLAVSRQYHWNKNHQLIKQQDQLRGSLENHYDSRGQITERHNGFGLGNLPAQEQFSYTATSLPGLQSTPTANGLPTTEDTQYQSGGRIQQQGKTHYQYDKAGRVIEKREEKNGFRPQITQYRWDAEGRLSQLRTPKGETWHYQYDALGRRIRKLKGLPTQTNKKQTTESQGTEPTSQKTDSKETRTKVIGTHYHWDGDHLIQEAPVYADGSIAWDQADEWIYEPNSFTPIAKQTVGDRLYYVVTDHLGTPKELITEDGKHTAWAGQMTTWGKYTGNIANRANLKAANEEHYATDCPIRFQGQWEDEESGLHYNRHRYYDPEAAQYISPDPIGLEGGLNPQAYVKDPEGWVDPLGLQNTSVIEGAESNLIYRGDDRNPNDLFNKGFKPWGNSKDLQAHALNQKNPPSNFVATSQSEKVANDFATNWGMREGYIYTIDRPSNGIDVNKVLGGNTPFPHEVEIAVPNHIDGSLIRGATPVNSDGSYKGHTILNPNYYSK